MSYYRSSPDDRWNRERFLIDYIAPFYTEESLLQVILPLASSVDRVIRNRALLYKDRPARGLATDGKPSDYDEAYQGVLKTARIGSTAKRWHRQYSVCGAVLVGPVVVSHRGKQRIKYRTITPDLFRLLMDDDGNIVKVLYQAQLTNAQGAIAENIIVVWTDTEHYYRNVGGEKQYFASNPDGVNPYGMIPFVLAAKDPDRPFDYGLQDLVEDNMQMNLLESGKIEDAMFAMMTIPFGVNITNPKQDFKFSPRRPIIVENAKTDDSPPDFQLVSGNAHGDKIDAMISEKEKRSALREGVAAHLVNTEPTELSGKALQIMSSEALQMREDDIDVFGEFESELAALTAVVWNAEVKQSLPDYDGMMREFYCDFAEIRFDEDPQAELEYDIRLMEANLINGFDILKKINTDVQTDDDAQRVIEQNKQINQLFRTRGFALGGASDATRIVNSNTITNG